MPDAMKKIREDLGPDAVILNSRTVREGLFRKKRVEVIAAVDPDPAAFNKPKDMNGAPIFPADLFPKKGGGFPESGFPKEIQELKGMLRDLKTEKLGGETVPLPVPVREILKSMRIQGFQNSIVEDAAEKLLESYFARKSSITDKELWEEARIFLTERLQSHPFGAAGGKRYILFLGPTGVGKTTTLAKIAAHYKLNLQRNISLLTLDTYRIGAVEQLKTYAKILNVPIEVCYTQEDVRKALDRFGTSDHIFIDTAGRNYRNSQFVDELADMLPLSEEWETYLVFSLTAKEEDMADIYRQFSRIPIDKFIFTKLDETNTRGAMANMVEKYEKGVAYLTNGQEVPDDLMEATPEILIQWIIGAGNDG